LLRLVKWILAARGPHRVANQTRERVDDRGVLPFSRPLGYSMILSLLGGIADRASAQEAARDAAAEPPAVEQSVGPREATRPKY
jgi:hypothetical protein